MRFIILGTLILCTLVEAKAQQDSVVTIRGVVLDVLGKPLEGSQISIFGSDDVERTDGSGSFELGVEQDLTTFSRIMITHMGYSSVQIPLKEFQGTRHNLSVMMSPKRKESRYVIR